MKSILIKLLSIILTVYITSIIIFKQNYFNITHLIDFLLLSIFLFLMIIERSKNYKFNVMIILYALFIVVSLASSLWGIAFERPSYKSLQLFIILINLFVIYNIIKKYDLMNYFLYGVLLGSLINYLILFNVLHVSFDIYMGSLRGARAIGTMGNPNILATTMIISMLMSMIYLFRKNKINVFYYYQFINIIVAMYIILLTVSKKGIILGSLLICLYGSLLIKSKKGLLQLFFILITGIIISQFFIDWSELYTTLEKAEKRFDAFSSAMSGQSGINSTSIRQHLIEFGLKTFQSNPILGHGLDNYRLITTGQYAHNNPVELLVGVGLLGTLFYYAIHVFLLKKIYEMKRSDLKYLLYFFVLSIILMDMASVTYGVKFTTFTILYVFILAESESSLSRKSENS